MHDNGHEPEQAPHRHEREVPLPAEFDETTDTPGKGGVYVYVKGELLIGDDDREAALAFLRARYPDVAWDTARLVELEELDMSKLLLPEGAPPVPEIVDAFRYDDQTSSLSVYPHHVLALTSHSRFAPCGPPLPIDPNQPRAQQVLQAIARAPAARAARVGVLDTGVVRNSLPSNRCDFRTPQDIDPVNPAGNRPLANYEGHGTFVAGVILQHTVNARVTARRIQSRTLPLQGHITDQELADALRAWRLEASFQRLDVLNLSVAGSTHGGSGLPLTDAALQLCRQVRPDLVIVAGAGNDNTNQSYYPAAFPYVIGVAALRDTLPDQRACFSNLGSWVRACAPGARVVSAFLRWPNRPMDPYPAPPGGCGAEVPASPAVGINVSFNMVAEWRGTSFASPVVAAWIAHRMVTGNVTGPQAALDLQAGTFSGLGQQLTNLGRVVRPPF